jgi:DNA mismatch repair protein MutS2
MNTHALERLDFYSVRERLARYALCDLGRKLAQTINPIGRQELLVRWFQQVNEFEALIEDRGTPPFGGISDVRDLVRECAPPLTLGVDQVADIGRALKGTHAIAAYLRDLPESMSELTYLAQRIGDFETVAERVDAVIDDRGQVRDTASSKLMQLRRQIAAANDEIKTRLESLLRDPSVKRILQFANFTYHNDRLVLPVRAECRGRLPGIVHRTSDSGATIYVEPSVAVEINNRISNLRSEEIEEINRLLWDLTHEIYLNHDEIIKTLDSLAVLDLIVAKTRYKRAFSLSCPKLSEHSTINLIGARHPLLLGMQMDRQEAGEEAGDVIPIDVRLGEDFDLLIITGPNTGGKTVTLKTVGLLTVMAHAGIPIPAQEGSTVGTFSNVLIDIGDEQSMQQSLSTFSAHMTRILEMLRNAGPRTLVLIDELGAGTDPDEGGALGRTIMDELLRLQSRCIVTTHLGVLKGFALTRERAENGSVEFDIETLRPTYHLNIGEAGASNAIEIAQRLGMPKRLVSAARRNLSHRAKALRSAIAGASAAKREAEHARKSAVEAQANAAKSEAAAAQAAEKLQRQQSDFQEWVRRVAHLQPGDAVRVRNFDRDGKIVRVRLDLHRAEVSVGAFSVEVPLGDVLPPETPPPPPAPEKPAKAPAPAPKRKKAKQADNSAGAQQRRKPEASQPRPRPKIPPLTEKQLEALKPGDEVYAIRFNRAGTIARLNINKQVAIVSLGLLEVEIPREGLALPPARQAKLPRRKRSSARLKPDKPAK